MDPRNKFEDDCYKKNVSEGEPRECVLEDDFTLKSSLRGDSFLSLSLRATRRGQAVFKLEKGVNRKMP